MKKATRFQKRGGTKSAWLDSNQLPTTSTVSLLYH